MKLGMKLFMQVISLMIMAGVFLFIFLILLFSYVFYKGDGTETKVMQNIDSMRMYASSRQMTKLMSKIEYLKQ
jgi:hypothetical protein